MTMSKNFLATSLSSAALLISLQGCTSAYESNEVASTQTSPVTEEAQAVAALPSGPAMWKVSDDDTTIYLFGTVHALPPEVEWMSPAIESALDSSDTLVTEIDAASMSAPETQQIVGAKALDTTGVTLRSQLSAEQVTTYEAAMTSVGVPVNAFDGFKPWFAGMTLSVLPLMKAGYSPESGVEMVIESRAGEEMTREALETVEFQIGVFDGLPRDSQVEFLMATAEAVDEIPTMVDAMVTEWVEGDADGLAAIMNEGLTDPQLAEALLYSRNRNWADWVETRMDTPGTVFIAVGAGHLAGENSLQDYLAERGIVSDRIQ